MRFKIGIFSMALLFSFVSQASEEKARIISLAPSITEIVCALDAGERLVAVSDFCHYPPQVEKLPRVGGLLNPSLERIVELKPSLVLLLPSLSRFGGQLVELGISRLVVRADTLQDIFAAITEIGKSCGRESAARRLRQDIKSRLLILKERGKKLSSRRVLLVVGRTPGGLGDIWIAGADSYLGELCGDINAIVQSVPNGTPFGSISKEEIIAFNPEVIIDLSFMGKTLTPEDVATAKRVWQGLSTLQAVKTGSVYLPLDNVLVTPGPRVAQAAEILFKLIH